MNLYRAGESVPLSVVLEDGREDRYPAGFAYLGAVLETQVNLAHQAVGRYEASWSPLTSGDYHVLYRVYSDPGRTIEDVEYGRAQELWRPIDALSPEIAETILREPLGSHSGQAGSVAEAIDNIEQRLTLARAEALDDLPGTTVDVTLIRKILKNRLDLQEGASGNWVLYDDDGATPLIVWDVRDKDGQSIRMASYTAARRDPQP